MRTSKQLLFVLSFVLSTSLIFAQSITWQLHHGQGEGIFVPGPNDPPIEEILNELTGRQAVHGDPGGFTYAEIPLIDDPKWETAPIDEDGDLCWRLDRSILEGLMSALDFTYFQTVINVTNTDIPFLVRYDQVDDGARAYVFNSAHPEGAFIEGGDARLFATPVETDLSPLFVVGVNRIVIVQFDDSQTANYLKAVIITDEEVNECGNDTEAPQMFGVLPDGSEVPIAELIEERYDCGEEPFLEVKVIDNCDPNPSFNERRDSITNVDGTLTISLQYGVRDKSGNENREIYTYIDGGEDTEAPRMFGVLPDGTEAPLVELIQERFDCNVQPFESVKVIDNCDPEPDLQTVTTFSPNPDGSQSITIDYTVTDASGNSSQEIYTYVDGGSDLELPSISRVVVRPFQGDFIRDTILIIQDFRTDTFPCTTNSVALPYDELIVTDNCDPEPDVTVTVDSTFTADGSLISTLTITAADINGNINQKRYTYVIKGDTEGPILNCSLSSVRIELEDSREFIPSKDNLNIFATDDCGGDISYEFEPAVVTNIGSTLVKVIVTDENENTSECSVEVFIEGLPCDLSITGVGGRAASCLGDATGSLIILASSTNGAVEYSIDGNNFQTSNVFENLLPETYEITIREIENPACSISDSFTIISDADDEAPQIIAVLTDDSEVLLSEAIQESYSCGELPFSEVKAIDNCDPNPSLDIMRSSTTLENGVLRFNLKISTTDANNNENQESYTYHVIPDQAPQIFAILADGSEMLLSEVIQENYDCSEQTFIDLKAIDDCDPNPSLEVIADSMLLKYNGALFIDLIVNTMDANGNENREIYAYSITDTEAPQILAVQITTVEENGEEITLRDTIPFSEIVVDTSLLYTCNSSPLEPYSRIIAIDNCDASINPLRTTNIRPVTDASGNTISITTVTYKASDASGNTAADSIQYSSALSEEAPVFTSCPRAPIIVNLSDLPSNTFIPVVGENILASAEDSCDGQELTYTYEPAEITQPGVSQITIIAIDSDGNESAACVVIVNALSNINDSPIDDSQAALVKKTLQVNLSPNPFFQQTNLQMNLEEAGNVKIIVRDINGRLKSRTNYEHIEAGQHNFELHFSQLNQGVYFLSVQTNTARRSIKIVIF